MTHILCTQRLLLRPLVAEDAGTLTPLIADFEVSKWLTHAPYPYTLKDGHAFVARQSASEGRVWTITQDDTLMGVIGVQRELGYWLGRPFWRQGYMAEAARAVTDNWFGDEDHQALISGHFVGNTGSRAVLAGLGFADTHTEDVHSLARDQEVPLQRMRLTRQTWETRIG